MITLYPLEFPLKKKKRLLIRPKGDWSGASTYSTTAMNYTTLLHGLARLPLHNRVPIIQVFILRAVNSQPRLSHIISGAKRQECTFGHSEDSEVRST